MYMAYDDIETEYVHRLDLSMSRERSKVTKCIAVQVIQLIYDDFGEQLEEIMYLSERNLNIQEIRNAVNSVDFDVTNMKAIPEATSNT